MPDPGARALMRAVRPTVILKYLAQLQLALVGLTCVPALVALLLDDIGTAQRYALVIVVLLLVSVPLARLPEPRQIQRNEALCVTALLFLITPLLMSYPLMTAGLSWIDAWFEAVSGVTTTGLSTLADIERQPPSFLFGRAWMQWYGGLGIAVLAVALIMGNRVTSKQLLNAAGEEGKSTTARSYARQVLQVYLILTLLGFVLIWADQLEPLPALLLSLSAVSTGGFSSFGDSLASLPLWVQWVLTLLSLAGAISLPLYYLAFRRRQVRLLFDPEIRALLIAMLLLTLLLMYVLLGTGELDWPQALQHSLMLAVSAQSTTGFSSLEPATLAPDAKLLLILGMLVGGSTASTAGGLKIIRLLILLRLIQLTLQRVSAPPRAVLPPRLGRTPLDEDEISDVLVLVGLWGLLVLLSWLLFLAFGLAPLDALFEIVSALGTVGLSVGITSPDLAPALKMVLAMDMLLGRLEIVALLVLLYPPTWFERRRTP
ncbi:MAG: TrkH family potassium uptake protein [Oceanospirillaceae bacterium]|nr:TrkH family potassium uptake protein [Oceanospirillaceae bacterium]